MRSKFNKDVLVVGGGPVGLTAALCMRRRGLDVQLIDEEWRTGAHSYALALHPGSLELLARLGLADEVMRAGTRIDTLEYFVGSERVGTLRFSELGGAHPFLVVLRQDAFEDLLERSLTEAGVSVDWNHRLSALEQRDEGVLATVEQLEKESGGYAMAGSEWVVERTRKVQARYVVGADGHRSSVRRLLDIQPSVVGPAETYAVFEFDCAQEPPGQVRVMLGPQSGVYWPMGERRCRFSFRITEREAEAGVRAKNRLTVQFGRHLFPHLGNDTLASMLQQRAPWFTSEVRDLQWSIAVRFERTLVTRFGHQRGWLIGDAAHQAGPVGVHSMNVGLLEGEDLAQRIEQGLRQPSAASLEGFGQHWSAQWRALMGLEGGLVPGESAPAWAIEHRAMLPVTLPASGKDLVALGAQLGLKTG